MALVSGWLVAAALIEAALWVERGAVTDRLLAGELSLVLFAVIAAAPLIPLQTCVLGSAIGVLYGVTAPFAANWSGSLQIFIVFLTCFATVVSALLYAQRRAAFEAHERAVRIQETLSSAQSRAQLAETAMSVGRLAAALTHEINTPLGALKSAVGTLLLLSSRQAEARPEERERLSVAETDLGRSIHESAERLSMVVAKLKRLVTLEDSEKQTVHVNDLLADVKLMIEGAIADGVQVIWKLQETPQVLCNTNQMRTVFYTLLKNAAGAVEQGGQIEISTTASSGNVEIAIRDNGRGMNPADLTTIFDPGFKVENGRVLGGNWSLFTARQIVNEHGGDIWIESQPGEGTTAYVSLPALLAMP
jgi:signal transduction histidine kinase